MEKNTYGSLGSIYESVWWTPRAFLSCSRSSPLLKATPVLPRRQQTSTIPAFSLRELQVTRNKPLPNSQRDILFPSPFFLHFPQAAEQNPGTFQVLFNSAKVRTTKDLLPGLWVPASPFVHAVFFHSPSHPRDALPPARCLRMIFAVQPPLQLTWMKGLLQIWMLSVTFKLRRSRLLTIFIKTGRECTMVLLNTIVKT